MDADTASVIARLEAYERRFDELIDLLSGALPLHGQAKALAQSRLKSLKDDLGAEHRKMSTVRGQAALTETERTCYADVIHQTHAEISVPTNSIPDGKWHNELFGARINITHMLHELRRGPE